MIIRNKLTKPPSLYRIYRIVSPHLFNVVIPTHINLIIHECSAFVRNRITMWVDVIKRNVGFEYS